MSPHEKTLAIRGKDGRAVAFHQSLYPSCETIDTFERHYKGSAQEILQMGREEQTHIHSIEKKIVNVEATWRLLGIAFGFLLCVCALVGGIVLVLNDKSAEGWVALVSALAMVFLAFIKNSKVK